MPAESESEMKINGEFFKEPPSQSIDITKMAVAELKRMQE